jgi:dTDP-4-dehydrorhamnose reductase
MLKLGKERDKLSVVADQTGSPTYTYDLARLIADMIVTDKYRIYHATNEGYCSWYEFACEIFKLAGLDVEVSPIKTENYLTKAKRLRNSCINKRKLKLNNFKLLRDWKGALKEYFYQSY